jgi:hypothetical protein
MIKNTDQKPKRGKKGKSFIVQDDIGNTYDRVGEPYSNFKP